MTVSELIDLSFIDLGTIQPGEGITSDMRSNAFTVLNAMIGNWSAERTVTNSMNRQQFNLTAGVWIYAVGLFGSLASAGRPMRITSWNSSSGNFSTGGRCISFEEFRAKTLNATARTSILPELIATDENYPNINLEVFPTPAVNPGILTLDFWTPFTPFAAVGDTVIFAVEYIAALHFNLAVALSPQYARTNGITSELAANAQNSKQVIMQKNAEILGLTQPQAATQQ